MNRDTTNSSEVAKIYASLFGIEFLQQGKAKMYHNLLLLCPN